jgi:ABC-type bacteriocin/lantibiotic exporter with double-glycine peptidase domain
VPIEQFEESFTGIVLTFEKTDAFEEGGSKPDTLKYARKRLEGLAPAVTFVMLTAAVTSLISILNTSLGQVFMDRILTKEEPEWLMPLIAIMLVLALIVGLVSILPSLAARSIPNSRACG